MSMNQEDFDRFMTQREARNRPADPADPMGRFRNQSRSMFVDRKNYTGGPLRGAVSDRRAEWMGGGAGGRMGEDWRNHQAIDVQREGSGLDPFSYAIAKKVRGGIDKSRQKRAGRRVMRDQLAKAESAGIISEMRDRSGTVEPAVETSTVEPTTNTGPLLSGETGPETARWNAAFPAMQARIAGGGNPPDERLWQYNRTE